MAMFNSYVSLPEGIFHEINPSSYHLGPHDDNADFAFQVNTVKFQVQTVTQAGGRHPTGMIVGVTIFQLGDCTCELTGMYNLYIYICMYVYIYIYDPSPRSRSPPPMVWSPTA